MVRTGLKSLIAEHPQLKVVAEAGSAAEAVMAARRPHPDVILLDLRLKGGTGIEVCRQLRAEKSPARILILTSYANETLLADAIEAGAEGYLLKDVDGARLVQSITKVAAGESIFDAEATRLLAKRLKGTGPGQAGLHSLRTLSPQESRVLEVMARGKTNKEIAAELNLSDKTVKNYVANLMGKLGIGRRAEAVSVYLRAKQEEIGVFGS